MWVSTDLCQALTEKCALGSFPAFNRKCRMKKTDLYITKFCCLTSGVCDVVFLTWERLEQDDIRNKLGNLKINSLKKDKI